MAGFWQPGEACGVTVAVLLFLVLQVLVTLTQYFLTELIGGVVKVALSPPTGLVVSGAMPSNHWKCGSVPLTITCSVVTPLGGTVVSDGCWVMLMTWQGGPLP